MKRFVLLISVTVFVLWNAPTAFSCTCMFQTHAKDFRDAKAVFIGRVISVTPNTGGDELQRRELPYVVRLRVEKRWRGAHASEIAVLSNNGTGGCGGFHFREGEKYLVYADGKEPVAYTACTRNRPLKREDEYTAKDLRQLNSSWFRLKSRLWPF